MYKVFGKSQSKFFAAMLCIAIAGTAQAFSKPKSESVKEEAGYYYGYGKGATNEEALALAKKDLVETALTATLRQKNSKAARITASDASVAERLVNIKPTYPNSKNLLNVYYRVSVKDWEKDAKAFDEKLRASLMPRYDSLSRQGAVAAKIETAVGILNELAANGETELLTLQADGTELFSRKIESVCQSILNNLQFTISAKNGIVGPDTEFTVNVSDNTGAAVPNLSVKAVWEIPDLAISTTTEEIPEVVSLVKTNGSGNAKIDYPVGEGFLNKIVCLTVSTAFSMSDAATTEMRKLDALSAVEGHYVYYDNLEAAYKSVTVEAGEYKTGAVAQDRRAGIKEKERTVELSSFAIDVYPVTNMQYAAYLYTIDADFAPEYFNNDDYNHDKQPVVGITAADAEAYAQWLSEQTGWNFRLPTDDEWEVAARAGTENIYPWGDDVPSKSKSANYKGNGTFKTPSPVGSFDNGNNAWGLVDMAGNVWEWTATSREAQEGFRTVKGGSWMDGPVDLRISNYKNIDAESNGPDVGFRLVKEVIDEN